MAYLKPQTPLKDLNSGDYFYPLTTIDQIITGTSRLSAFLSEDNNLLNLTNIGNLSVNGTSYFNGDTIIPTHLAVGGYNNTSYSLSTASFICNSWIRTVGSTGWYNETYGGGWYMTDNTWIRNYGSKKIYLDNMIRMPGSVLGSSWVDSRSLDKISLGVDASDGTSSVAYSICGIRFSSVTYAIASERAGQNFGIFGWTNSRTENGYDWGFFISSDRYFHCNTRVYGAVWNDYAEFRKGQMNILKPGQVVTENGDGSMRLADKKLQKGCKILSDTYGFAIGETEECKLPIAVSGRVLIYCDTPKEELEPGDCLCANYTGNAIKMTKEEIIQYPDRIIATVSEIPSYKIWHGGDIKNKSGDIIVDSRIWVYVR